MHSNDTPSPHRNNPHDISMHDDDDDNPAEDDPDYEPPLHDEIYANGYLSPEEELQLSQERLQEDQQHEYDADNNEIIDDVSEDEDENKTEQDEEQDGDDHDIDDTSAWMGEEMRIVRTREEPLQELPSPTSIRTIIHRAHPPHEDRIEDHFMDVMTRSDHAGRTTMEISREYQYKVVTQEQYEKGRDIQGIDWSSFPFTRTSYRRTRREQYQRFTNLAPPTEELKHISQDVIDTTHPYYHFTYMEQRVKPQFQHFQLRHLCWSPAQHSIFTMSHHSLRYYNTHNHHQQRVMTFDDHNTICSMAVSDGLMYAGGLQGQVFCQNMSNGLFLTTPAKLTESENAICNAITPYHTPSGAQRVIISNNDSFARNFDVSSFKAVIDYRANWPVNHCSGSPTGSMVILSGDHPISHLIDAHTGQRIASLEGHTDFTFSTSWHPDGIHVATANQDCTTRIWDIRHPKMSIATLVGSMCAIRSCHFSHDGAFLLMAEAADFIHMYATTQHMYKEKQTVDFFGEIAGVCFTPTDESIFIALSDRRYGGLMEWSRTKERMSDMIVL